MVPADDIHSCYDAYAVADHRNAERAVIQAALAAEMALANMTYAEAHSGGRVADQVLALLDATAALRVLEVQP
jgi:hypothetical protein